MKGIKIISSFCSKKILIIILSCCLLLCIFANKAMALTEYTASVKMTNSVTVNSLNINQNILYLTVTASLPTNCRWDKARTLSGASDYIWDFDNVGSGTRTFSIDLNKAEWTDTSGVVGFLIVGTSIYYGVELNININKILELPSQIVGLSGVVTGNTINLSWDESPDSEEIQGYKIYVNGSLYGTSFTNSYSINDLHGTYRFSVSAINEKGEGYRSDDLLKDIINLPDKVIGLSGFVSGSTLELNWDENSAEDNVLEYKIYANDAYIGTSDVSSYRVNDLPEDTYNIAISAVNIDGEGEKSSILTKTILSAPVNFTAEVENKNIVLNWDAVNNAIGYRVYYNSNVLTELSPKVFTYTIEKINYGIHDVAFCAIGFDGEGIREERTINFEQIIIDPLIMVENVYQRSADISWASLDEALKYKIYDSEGNIIDILNNTVNEYQFKDLEENTEYEFGVSAEYETGNSNIAFFSFKTLYCEFVDYRTAICDLLENTESIINPLGGLLALGLSIKGFPLLISAVKTFLMRG